MKYPLKLNLGCGTQVVDEWVNVDYSYGARLQKITVIRNIVRWFKLFNVEWDNRIFIHNLTKPFPWGDDSASVIYSSHTLEHMDRDDGMAFLKECHRVLKPDGIIRIVVPDLEPIVERYINKALLSEHFLEELHVLRGKPPKSLLKRLIWPYIGFPHQCMYDTESLIRIMKLAGFEVTSEAYADSQISDIRAIEIEERTVDAVVVEGHKA